MKYYGLCNFVESLFSHVVLIFRETLFACFTWNDMMPSISKNQGVFKSNAFSHCFPRKRKSSYDFVVTAWLLAWTSQGLNLGPPDYESVALTNWATSPEFLIRMQRYSFYLKYGKNSCCFCCFLTFLYFKADSRSKCKVNTNILKLPVISKWKCNTLRGRYS